MKRCILAGLAAILFPTFVFDTTLKYSNSVFSVIAFVGIYALLSYAQNMGIAGRKKCCAHVLGGIFSVFTAFGSRLEGLNGIPYGSITLWCAIALYTHVFGQGIGVLWTILERGEHAFYCSEESIDCENKLGRFVDRLLSKPLILWIVLLLCWAPCYISTFPGNLVYDATYEYLQLEFGFIKSFPLLHSAIVTRLFLLSDNLTGSVNAGVAIYVIVQMLLVAALFTTVLYRFYRDGLHPWLLVVLVGYYAAFPVIPLLVTCTTRDVMFSTLMMFTVYQFYRLARDPEGYMSKVSNVLLLATSLVFTLLSRNNNSGPLAILLLLAMCGIICFVFGRRFIRNSILFTVATLGMFYAVTAVLTALCQPLYDASPASAMSILAQPIVRAHTLYGDEWDQEERAEFESYFNMERLEYVPQNADTAKDNLLVRYKNLRQFLAFWIKMGLRYPGCYLDAVLANTRQMWYPGVVIDGYIAQGKFPSYEKNYFYFGKYMEDIGSRLNLLPQVFAFYENIGLRLSFERIPIVSMLFSIGFHVWMLLHCLFYAVYRKSYRYFWPVGIVMVYTICCICVPLVLLRYFGALFFACPMIIVCTLCPQLVISK